MPAHRLGQGHPARCGRKGHWHGQPGKGHHGPEGAGSATQPDPKTREHGQLAGGIAHDFNNLLTIIRGYTGLLLGVHKSGPLSEAAEEVIKASEQGEALTRQLLSFSRNQPIAPRRLKLNDIVAENENMLRQLIGDKIRLVADLDPSPRTVLADPGQIHQVLVNLALNALDAMPEGGKLTVTSKAVEINEHGAAGMPDVQPGHYVMLVVADTGMGMPEDVKEHLFEPFFTTKPGRGTGLGLASVYGIVRQSGGHISVESELGRARPSRSCCRRPSRADPRQKRKDLPLPANRRARSCWWRTSRPAHPRRENPASRRV